MALHYGDYLFLNCYEIVQIALRPFFPFNLSTKPTTTTAIEKSYKLVLLFGKSSFLL